MATNTNYPPAAHPLVCIPLLETRQVTADIAYSAGADVLVPFKCRVVGIVGVCAVIGGSVDPTDLDLNVRKFTGSGVALTTGVMAVVNSSTLVEGGVEASLVTTESQLIVAAGNRLQLDIDITGGTSPTCDGVGAYVYVVPID